MVLFFFFFLFLLDVLMHINLTSVNVVMLRGSASEEPGSWTASGLYIQTSPESVNEQMRVVIAISAV